MRKILILAYDFPPYNTIGAQRPYAWYKYFKSFDLYPVIVTRHWDKEINSPTESIRSTTETKVSTENHEYGTIIKAPYKANLRDKIVLKRGNSGFNLWRKLTSLYYSIFQYLFFCADNKSGIYKAADEYLKENKCDYIIATGEPFVLFKYASKLSKKYKIPWIADYRDGWSTNYSVIYEINFFNYLLNELIFKHFEKNFVRSASFITTTANSIKYDLLKLHHNKNVEVVFNGFFEEYFLELNDIEQNKNEFEIAYAGTIYPYQKLEVFLEGLSIFVKQITDAKLKIVFYGSDFYSQQSKRIFSYNTELNKYIKIEKKIPHKEVLRKLKEANLLLLLVNSDFKQVYAKIFDYIALDRKILMIVNDNGDLEQLLNITKSGIICESAVEFKEQLVSLYEEFIKNKKIESTTVNAERYSRKNQTKHLVEILNKL